MQEVATCLAMSERSLRRRLRTLGTSYTQILGDVRAEAATAFLSDPTARLDGIAECLGYTEAANFRHAFRRWMGCSPTDFRRAVPSNIGTFPGPAAAGRSAARASAITRGTARD